MEPNTRPLVVNLFGVPGAGKSTGAAYIFAKIKMLGVNAELITEFAKDKTWERNDEAFKNQAYVFGEQAYRISRCADKVDVIVTDSPLPLSIMYNSDKRLTENFNKTVMDVFKLQQHQLSPAPSKAVQSIWAATNRSGVRRAWSDRHCAA